MQNIGITGGIGVGKTTICKIFETFGIPVYYADDRAKRLMTSSKSVKSQIKELFGKEAYFRNGRLNRDFIRKAIFSQNDKLKAMNAIVHPAVFQDAIEWISQQNAPYSLQEAALLVESGRYKSFDKLIVVTAPEKVKIERVKKRDRKSTKEVQTIINKQLPDQAKIDVADFIIYNDGEHLLIPQVQRIHEAILSIY